MILQITVNDLHIQMMVDYVLTWKRIDTTTLQTALYSVYVHRHWSITHYFVTQLAVLLTLVNLLTSLITLFRCLSIAVQSTM